ncbi:MAG TPA: hypothetical protein VHG08_26915 [Longimicrobium sp.]|nr:hypothetical protein [Longimicrobium sp.]
MKFAGWMTMLTAAALAACTPPAPPPAGPAPEPGSGPAQPGQDPAAVAAELQRGTLPASPRQVTFGWELDEAGASFRGRGVARYEAPRRVRLDLFGPRGETFLAAALVDGEVRAPAMLLQRFRLPSPGLLWGAVGVMAPPADARLLNATTGQGGDTLVRYQLGGDVLEYRARGGRLQSVRRLSGGGVAESVDLTWGDQGPSRAQYRDWAAFRNLTLTVEQSTDVESFPEDTWTPPGT